MIAPDRLPPQNAEAEVGVIGSALLLNELIDDLAMLVCPEDFYVAAHAAIWRAIVAMHASGTAVDGTTLCEALERSCGLSEIGGPEAIVRILNDVPHAANGEYYAKIVKQKAVSRNLIEMANRMLVDGYSNQFTADELVQRADLDLSRVADAAHRKALATIGDAARDAIRRRELRDSGLPAGLSSGFPGLDSMIGGLRPSQLMVIGARPGIGKTSIAMDIMRAVSSETGKASLFVSLEMGLDQIGDRAVCSALGLDSSAYRGNGRLDRRAVDRMLAELSGLPVLIEETPALPPSRIAALARKVARGGNLGVVVVDYLQIVGADDRREDEYEKVGKAATALKVLSKQVKAPVVALSQLNRKVEEREDKRPKLSDLRATGQIEQDADVVGFLYRDHYYNPQADPRSAELIVAKNREGATGTVPLRWNGPLTRFENPEADVDFGPADGGGY
jgi:replicative DNA helicase